MNIAFTIVLNGMPFIKEQYKYIPKCFDKWYIVEGAVKPSNCTSWCKTIPEKYLNQYKCSTDGTYEFLNEIQSDKIKVIRKNDFWDGKLEMCNSFMPEIENCTLMQIDVDEFWKEETLKDIFEYNKQSIYNDTYDFMTFKCNYYVGSNLKIITENTYGDMWYEWYRLWNIKNKTHWVSHEPPRIKGCTRTLTKTFTSKFKNWTFDHYAYFTKEQLQFKEDFYGYKDAVKQWQALQECNTFPCRLSDYLNWVKTPALVERIAYEQTR